MYDDVENNLLESYTISLWGLIFFVIILPGIVACIYTLYREGKGKETSQMRFLVVFYGGIFIMLVAYIGYHEIWHKLAYQKWLTARRMQLESQPQKAVQVTQPDTVVVAQPEAKPVKTPKPEPVETTSRSSSYYYGGSSYDDADDYDIGYKDGYLDGIHRDHGAHSRSEDYEYEDGYSQGYYDAVGEDLDFEDDEEEGWW